LPLAARAQQPMPVIAFIDPGTAAASAQFATAFRQGLNETGYSEGRNTVTAETTVRELQKAAGAFGLQIQIVNAANSREIEAAFATMSRERAQALFVAADAFFASRRVQFATLASRNGIPATYSRRDYVEVGGFMSYGTDIVDNFRQVGVYAGKILNGEKPSELPVMQSTKFEFVINLQTARALGLDVPSGLLLAADEVIE
jgi:putative tryptophan/tyrosine transport system substrate-binding protein